MTQAKPGDSVKVHYTAELEDGRKVVSSIEQGPLEFTIGEGKVIQGLEQAVVGMGPGESKTEEIPADQAFGPHREELIVAIDRHQIREDVPLEIGKQYMVPKADGGTRQVVLTDISASKVTFDANHPLAGLDLILHVQLLEIA